MALFVSYMAFNRNEIQVNRLCNVENRTNPITWKKKTILTLNTPISWTNQWNDNERNQAEDVKRSGHLKSTNHAVTVILKFKLHILDIWY